MHYQNSAAHKTRKPRYSYYHKLFFLYALNLVDWLCTEALLSTGKFVEANPLMNTILGHFFPTLLIKGILPLALTILCAVLFRLARVGESRIANIMLNTGIIAYSLVNLWHIVNFVLLFTV